MEKIKQSCFVIFILFVCTFVQVLSNPIYLDIDKHLKDFGHSTSYVHDSLDEQVQTHNHSHKHSEDGPVHEHNHDHINLISPEIKFVNHSRHLLRISSKKLVDLGFLEIHQKTKLISVSLFRPPIS